MKKTLLIIFILLFSLGLTACNLNRTNPNPGGEPNPVDPTIPDPDDDKDDDDDEEVKGLTPIADAAVPRLADGWVCTWADEFNGTKIDETKWNFQIGTGSQGWGNWEKQYYRKENASIKDGKLVITAKKENYNGSEYTSSRMTTHNKGDFLYGRFQASLKLPTGRGTWPAFWMMPTKNTYGNWPKSGEIDIMEHVGYDPNVVHTTIHTQKYNHMYGTQIVKYDTVTSATSSFHLYELIWEPGKLTWLIDGERFFTTSYDAAKDLDVVYSDAFPFDHKFYMILNLAIGGNWGGAQGIDPNLTEAKYEIDFVRVYERDYLVLESVNNKAPFAPYQIGKAQVANTIFWYSASDDYGIREYNIYLNDVYHGTSRLCQYTFKNIAPGSYNVTVEAVDFAGNKSLRSEPFNLLI